MTNETANNYVLTGGGVEGTVDTTSITGKPVVDVRVGDRAVDAPELVGTELGLEVRGTLETIPDLREVRLTLILPVVNVDGAERTFAGVALITTTRTSIGGPRLVDGPLQSYELLPVSGTASAVQS
jgi:hypothetical protein